MLWKQDPLTSRCQVHPFFSHWGEDRRNELTHYFKFNNTNGRPAPPNALNNGHVSQMASCFLPLHSRTLPVHISGGTIRRPPDEPELDNSSVDRFALECSPVQNSNRSGARKTVERPGCSCRSLRVYCLDSDSFGTVNLREGHFYSNE